MKSHNIQVGFLADPLDCIVIVLCANSDSFHEQPFFLRYVIYDKGFIIDEPTRDEANSILCSYKGTPVKFIYGPCIYCRAVGITGPVGINLPKVLPPDPFELEKNEPYDDEYPKDDLF